MSLTDAIYVPRILFCSMLFFPAFYGWIVGERERSMDGTFTLYTSMIKLKNSKANEMMLHHNLLNAFLIPFPLTHSFVLHLHFLLLFHSLFSSVFTVHPSHHLDDSVFFLLSQAIFKLQFEINVIEKFSQANI